MDSETNGPMHMWGHALPKADRPIIGYAVCGEYIGRFTRKLELVDCTKCLTALQEKEDDEPTSLVSE